MRILREPEVVRDSSNQRGAGTWVRDAPRESLDVLRALRESEVVYYLFVQDARARELNRNCCFYSSFRKSRNGQ